MASEQSSRYIFLVDDEPIQNEMLKDYISERFQYKIKTYENGESAIKDMHLDPAFVVLDFHLNAHLPDAKNGVEVLKEMKELKPDTHVIMLSGQDKLEVAVDSMKYGAYDYVIKGETAFSRMQNIINNINILGNVKEANSSYKRVIAGLCVALGIVVLLSIYMVMRLK